MKILDISETAQTATVKLDSSELVKLCNALYHVRKMGSKTDNELESMLVVCREVSQYGHIDAWALSTIAELRKDDISKNLSTAKSKNKRNA